MIKRSEVKIFIIDDDSDFAGLVKTILKNNGMDNVHVFTDPYKMLSELREDVKIIIVDYYLNSDLDGLDVIKEIVKSNRQCFFIMLSGQKDMGVVIDYMNSVFGTSRYIKKGTSNVNELIARYVKEFIEYIQILAETYAIAANLEKQTEDLEKLIDDGK